MLDSAVALLALIAGLWVRQFLLGEEAALWGSTAAMESTIVAVTFVWLLVLANHGAYEVRYFGAGPDEYRAVVRSAVTLVALVAFVSFALQLSFSRGVLLVSLPLMVVATIGCRYAMRRSLASARREGESLRSAVLVGDPRAVRDAAERIAKDPATTGLSVVGVCVTDPSDPVLDTPEFAHVPVLGVEDDTLTAVDATGAQVVAIASSPSMAGRTLQRLGWALEQRDVDLLIAPGIVDVAGPRLSLRRASGLPMLYLERPVSSGFRFRLKMAADRVLALVALVALSPLFGLVALAVRRDSAGPALFRQYRVGEGGRIFSIVKFRTMVTDAESRLSGLTAAHDGNDVLFKLRQDPRITRVGAVLRRYSLDELPQLINVVRGEMSLVGPRPPLPREVDAYEPDAVRRLRVRPGMTGLWQVSGRSDLSWIDSLRLDLWYVDNWSLSLDAQILLRTVRAVLRGQGAY
ncbi:sugar transferase [Phycicoccus sp.]|uniref:sugar transferase n=1 Tax=Phycicoccus sp. TaxID=1902410 RepID=UPI002B967FD1|nr:sugar transferase [Phycicoccus sp.]HMM93424.1 sugar transferase [Phycicoccus sp.]